MLKILIVDDEASSRKLLQAILSRQGACDCADNGQAALDAFTQAHQSNHPYDLICLDIMMPEMDGIQVLKTIRRLEKAMGIRTEAETKVIMTTAVDDPRTVIDAFYLGGATSYVVKPIVPKKLLNEVKKLGLSID